MLPVLLLLLITVPLVELYVIIQVGQAIGAVPTIGLLLLASILGSLLLRAQGRTVWRRFRAALAAGRPPARETIDGALVIFGGALMITPGFVSDAFGIVLLLPPTRAFARRFVLRGARMRMLLGFGAAAGGAARRGRARQDYDVDSTARDVDHPGLPG